MKVYGKHYSTIWLNEVDPNLVQIIDKRRPPHVFVIEDFTMVDEVVLAIKEINVRG